jgi:hypothetical protein
MLGTEQASGPKAVDKARIAAGDRAGQAVQQLHSPRWVTVRVVGMRRDSPAGVSQVRRHRLDLHVEQPPVVGLPDIAHGFSDGEHSRWLGRHAAQDQEAGAEQARQAVSPVARLGQVPQPVRVTRTVCQVGCPPQALCVLAPCVLPWCCLASQPRPAEHRLVPIWPEGHPQRGRGRGPLGHRHVGRLDCRLGKPLPTDRVQAHGALAVRPQPLRGEPGQRAVVR